MNRFKIHFSNETQSDIYNGHNHDPATEPIVKRLNEIIGFYTVIVSISIVRVMFGVMVTLKCFTNASSGPSKLVGYSSLISLVNILLCVIMVSMYHEDIGNDLDKDLDIDRDMIGDKRHSIELIIGLFGILINLSALIITCGYDWFQAVEAQERTRRLRREAINERLRARDVNRNNEAPTHSGDNVQWDTRSDQHLITN